MKSKKVMEGAKWGLFFIGILLVSCFGQKNSQSNQSLIRGIILKSPEIVYWKGNKKFLALDDKKKWMYVGWVQKSLSEPKDALRLWYYKIKLIQDKTLGDSIKVVFDCGEPSDVLWVSSTGLDADSSLLFVNLEDSTKSNIAFLPKNVDQVLTISVNLFHYQIPLKADSHLRGTLVKIVNSTPVAKDGGLVNEKLFLERSIVL